MMALIAVLSLVSFSVPSELPRFSHADKLVHVFLYFSLAGLLIFELIRSNKTRTFAAVFALIFAAAYGGLMEFLQELLTVSRSADWLDWAADVAGAALACGICVVRKKMNLSRPKTK